MLVFARVSAPLLLLLLLQSQFAIEFLPLCAVLLLVFVPAVQLRAVVFVAITLPRVMCTLQTKTVGFKSVATETANETTQTNQQASGKTDFTDVVGTTSREQTVTVMQQPNSNNYSEKTRLTVSCWWR